MSKKEKVESWPVEAKAGLTLVIASAVIIGGALIVGANMKDPDQPVDIITSVSSNQGSSDSTNSSESINQVEKLIKPFTVNATCARYFYDMNDPDEIRSKAIVSVPNKKSTYMKSVGVDYTYSNKKFDVIASLDGKVIDKQVDSVYGNVLVIKHDSGIELVYSSLGDVLVNKGDSITQGTKIATSGESAYTSTLGSCLHFEIIKDSKYLNPEKSYGLEVLKL